MNATKLKSKLKLSENELKRPDYIRLHRAISWLKCGEEQIDNLDLRFITFWIAYNSCYAVNEKQESSMTERNHFNNFIVKLVENDGEKRIFHLLWNTFSGAVRLLITNEFIYKPFWDHHRGETKDWKSMHEKSIADAQKYLSNQDVPKLLEVVLDRLYTLRNQLMHGGATFKSKVNRTQLRDGCSILNMLLPVIIDIMMENKNVDWGKINYPVVGDR
jgi:hypothetical protein